MKQPKFQRLKYSSLKERGQILLIALGSIVDGFVNLLTLGEFDSGFRVWLLFEVFEEE